MTRLDAAARARAVELLGRFNDEMTAVLDAAFATHWAEIEEILALTVLAAEKSITTRRIAEVSGLDRRALSRMILRLRSEGLAQTRPARDDRRAVEVVLTARGKRQSDALRAAVIRFFLDSGPIAREISAGLRMDREPSEPGQPADPFELLHRIAAAGAALVNYMPEAATRGPLAARQRAALVQIVSSGGARPTELVDTLGVSRPGVTYIVDQLCAKGFVERRRGAVPEDRRAILLVPTLEGVGAVLAVMDGIERERERLSDLFAELAVWTEPSSR